MGEDHKSAWVRMNETLGPLHMGTELWDMAFDSHIEYRVAGMRFAEHWVKKHVETKWLNNWLAESFGTTADVVEVLAWIKIPFDMWVEDLEAYQGTAEYWDLIGQFVAIRQWLRELESLTYTAPFPSDLHIDIGGEDQAVKRWVDEQRAEVIERFHGAVWLAPPFDDLVGGYGRAALAFGFIGPQIVEQADKHLSQEIAKSGLSPCSLKALTDVGFYDPDELRRRVIRKFAEAVRNSMPPVI